MDIMVSSLSSVSGCRLYSFRQVHVVVDHVCGSRRPYKLCYYFAHLLTDNRKYVNSSTSARARKCYPSKPSRTVT